ncbi:hypothetical protein L7F22_050594 [Adiantum nelumboides]|nr:hypothetical protein [Adiantum nelumboides]
MISSAPTHAAQQRHPGDERRRPFQFKGVRRRRWGRWVAEIRVPNSRNRLWLGSYPTAHQAARAYDVAAACLRGASAILNLPSLPLPSHCNSHDLSPASIRNLAGQEAARLSSRSQQYSLHADGSDCQASDPAALLHNETHHEDLGAAAASHCDRSPDHLHPPSEEQHGAAPYDPPSLLDLWGSLELGPFINPHLKALLTRSLYPANGNSNE